MLTKLRELLERAAPALKTLLDVANTIDQALHVGQRFKKASRRALMEGANQARLADDAGEHDDGRSTVGPLDSFQQLESVDLRHLKIDDDDAEILRGDSINGLSRIVERRNLDAVGSQQLRGKARHSRIVVNVQNANGVAAHR